ncbi:HIT family protein [Hymenobacter cellulosilyticus]|uniref:HIT family protein n=1 Tax=Hymenobacter cellulosilyticus TaxID=2932248 RepID=UPI0035CA4CF7
MPSIFSRIVSGELPAYKVAEDEHHLAFLDITPLVEGHTLVIPKREVDYIFDMAPRNWPPCTSLPSAWPRA